MSPASNRRRRALSAQVLPILLAVSDKRLHGYAIIREVEQLSGGTVRLTASTLYSAINRMVEDGLITESEERPAPELDDERRRYFQITEIGREILQEEAERFQRVTEMARRKGILGGSEA